MTRPDEPGDPVRERTSDSARSAGELSATVRAEPLLFVGGGTMAEAIIVGAIEGNAVTPERLVVVDPKPDRRALFEALGVQVLPTIAGAMEALCRIESSEGEGQILLAIKPQVLDDVAVELAPLLQGERIVISILAGIRSNRIAQVLGAEGNPRVIRVMPNTPARIRQGMTAIAMGEGARGGDDALAKAVFAAVGEVVSIDENLMDAYTALAGSGPAYVFYLAEAMSAAAVRLGFSRDEADLIVRQTVAGAGNLMVASAQGPTSSPAALRAAVTSKNGTTHAATTRMDELGVMDAIITAVRAARDRGRELAQG
jgi:pyrroline-5-carboxylate reductase